MRKRIAEIAEPELIALLRRGLEGEADRVWFRAGCAPLATGHGWARKLPFRQLLAEDVEAVAGILLAQSFVPERLAADPTDAAHELPLLCELRGEALLEARFALQEGALVVVVEIARPLELTAGLDSF